MLILLEVLILIVLSIAVYKLIILCIPKEKSKTKVNSARPVEPVKTASNPVTINTGLKQESTDALYAKKHNMWVCRYCETLNANGISRCEACGMVK